MKIIGIILLIIYGVGVSYYSLRVCSRGSVVKQRREGYRSLLKHKYAPPTDEDKKLYMPEFLKEDDDDEDDIYKY